ncbi:MBL fold metallo-hydrolase [Amycolatopsis dongchuanensis]|uniref:MBL fold metallo-hydrolase n=1 Tax=Amycolatopsis dongchuanensis TaxID=1070866 RepID=A0ABP9QEM2_9PSEU
MKITKHAHACVELAEPGGGVLIDPGAFTPNAAELIARATAVLITHEHFDHVDAEALEAALSTRSDLAVWGPEAAVGRWREQYPDQVTAVRHGDRFTANGLEVSVHGEVHALIHPDIPQVANVGYLIGGSVYHPGDAYHVPRVPVPTLLVPTSGPWTKVGDAVDWVRAVKPDRLVQIHEIMLSPVGQQSMARFLGPDMLGSVPLTLVPVGESLDV